MEIEKILKLIVKNSLIFSIGGIIGLIITIFFFMPFLLHTAAVKFGLFVIVLAPLLFLLYCFLGFIAGGLLGLVVYYALKLFYKFKVSRNVV